MKKKIHPKYQHNCKVTCACGNSFTTGSTLPEIKVEICSACHPFFTGEEKYIDTLGRVERFKQKQTQAAEKKYVKKSVRKKLKADQSEKDLKKRPQSLKEMLKK
ncbi:50S ribosomal protein L31 [Patescibacteria group bacterium]